MRPLLQGIMQKEANGLASYAETIADKSDES
jgi:hypothetical protein